MPTNHDYLAPELLRPDDNDSTEPTPHIESSTSQDTPLPETSSPDGRHVYQIVVQSSATEWPPSAEGVKGMLEAIQGMLEAAEQGRMASFSMAMDQLEVAAIAWYKDLFGVKE